MTDVESYWFGCQAKGGWRVCSFQTGWLSRGWGIRFGTHDLRMAATGLRMCAVSPWFLRSPLEIGLYRDKMEQSIYEPISGIVKLDRHSITVCHRLCRNTRQRRRQFCNVRIYRLAALGIC